MPTPKYNVDPQKWSDKLPSGFSPFSPKGEVGGVAEELAALRREITDLRKMLSPPSAIILTGDAVRRHVDKMKDIPGF